MEAKTNIVVTKNRVTSKRYPEVLRFRLDPVRDDPIFGSASEMEGEIPFLNPVAPLRAYLAYIDANPDIITSLSQAIVTKYRDAWVNETDEEILAIVQNQLRTLLLVSGEFPEPLRHQKAVLSEILVISYALDGIVDDNAEDGVPELGDLDYASLMSVWSSADEPPFDEMPSGIADIERIKKVCKTCVDELKRVLGDGWKEFYAGMREDATSALSAHLLTFGMAKDGKDDESRFSEETMTELRRNLSGVKAVGNRIADLKNIRVPAIIRRDDLFQIVVNRAADIGLVLNAILGLPNDIRRGTVDSPISCSVVHDGVPLQTAFNIAMRKLHDLYKDYSLASAKLVELYGKCEAGPQVKAYVDSLNWYLDGMTLGYHIMDNYRITDKTQVVSHG